MFNGRIYLDKGGERGALLIHGFTSCTHQFRELSPFLANKGMTVMAPLVAGHGTKPEDLIKTSSRDWLKSVEEPLEFLQKKVKKVYLIGNSFGANLAFELALNHPVSGIVSLGAPIFLRRQLWIKLRLATDYRFRKYYRKLSSLYGLDYIDFSDEVTYPVIPIKSLYDLFYFIKNYTIPHLPEVKAPIFIAHTTRDQIINPQSAQYIHEHIGSEEKRIYWIKSFRHEVTKSKRREEIFEKIWEFISDN